MAILDRLRRSPKASTQPSAPRAETKERGRSGTVNTRGFLSSTERNAALQWPANLEVFDEMATTDPTCRWSLALLANPLLAADKEIEPASDSDEDREVAAFVDNALFNELDGGFEDFLRRALKYQRYGHSVFERVAAFQEVEFSYENEAGEDVEVKREGFVVCCLGERLPRTIQRWVPDEKDPRKLVEIEQWLIDGSEKETNPTIPAERLVIFVNEKEGDDWRGVSILRSAYFAYKTKLKLENLEAIGLERSAGLPLCYPPANATPDQKDAMETALASLRQGETLWLMAPGPKAGTTDDANGWLIEDLAIEGDASRSPSEAIERYKTDMARNVLAEFMRLGHEQVGARATADVQQDPYYQAISAHARLVEHVINEQVIEPLVRWNYEVTRYPQFKFGNIQAKNVQVLSAAIANLGKGSFLTADPELENYLRRIIDAPELAPEERERIELEKIERAQAMKPSLGDPESNGKPPDPQDKKPDKDKSARMSERTYRRPLRDEEFYVALTEIERSLDDYADDLVQAAEEAAREPIAALRRQIDSAVAMKAPEVIAKLELESAALVPAVEQVLTRAYESGRAQVRSELRRQGAGARMAETDEHPTQAELFAAKAVAIAASIAAAATRALRSFGLRRLEVGMVDAEQVGLEPLASVRDEARKAAAGNVNGAWAAGRRAEQLVRANEISEAIYSAILDEGTCTACTEADGRMGPPGGDPSLPTPNPNCHGGGRCRCMWIGIVKEEAVRLPIAATEAVRMAEERFDQRIAVMADQFDRAVAALSEAASVPAVSSQATDVPESIVLLMRSMTDEVKALAEREIVVNVPPQEPPVVNVPKPPAPKKGKRRVTFIRDDDGRPSGAEVEDV